MPGRNFVWLSSFPKSGNTWVRILLQLFESAEAGQQNDTLDLNSLRIGSHSAARSLVERFSRLVVSELSIEDLDRERLSALRSFSKVTSKTTFLKVHDRFRRVGGDCLFGKDISMGGIYIVRNPLDVSVSLANHEKCDYKEAVEMLNSGFSIAQDTLQLHRQLPQDVGCWSENVLSWVDQSEIPLLVIRYEDLVEDAVSELARILRFLGRDPGRVSLESVVNSASFDRLKEAESKAGFREKPAGMAAFFRSGRIGEGRLELGANLANMVIEKNESMMTRFGYSTELLK
jgi:hypothetical protein